MQATALRVADQRVELPGPLVAVLDTGTTGLGLPSKLFESYDRLRRQVAQEEGLKRAQVGHEIWLSSSDLQRFSMRFDAFREVFGA